MNVDFNDVVEPKIIRRDNDGNIYAIPRKLIDGFTYMNEAVTNAIGTDNWYEAVSELDAEYGIYKKD
jgi:hypothetical protein